MWGVKHFFLYDLNRSGAPVKPSLDWRQFVSINGVEFDCQWVVA